MTELAQKPWWSVYGGPHERPIIYPTQHSGSDNVHINPSRKGSLCRAIGRNCHTYKSSSYSHADEHTVEYGHGKHYLRAHQHQFADPGIKHIDLDSHKYEYHHTHHDHDNFCREHRYIDRYYG